MIRRPALLVVLFGLVLSVATGLQPASAQTAGPSHRPLEDFVTSDPYIDVRAPTTPEAQLADLHPYCVGYLNPVIANGVYYTGFAENEAGESDGVGVRYADSKASCALFDFYPRFSGAGSTGSLTIRMYGDRNTSKLHCTGYVQRWSDSQGHFVDAVPLEALVDTDNNAHITTTSTISHSPPFFDGERLRLVVIHTGDVNGNVCGADLLNHGVYKPNEQPPPPSSSPPVPQLACGRTMHDMGNGQWFAEVIAMVRNPPPTGATYTDTSGSWRTTWDAGEFYGQRASIALPVGAKVGDGRTVQYKMQRQYEAGTSWSMPTNQQNEITDTGSTRWLSPIDALDQFISGVWKIVDPWKDDTAQGTISAEDETGAPLPMVPTVNTTVKTVWATCHVNVDPDPDHEGEQVVTIINITNNPDDPNPPVDGGTPTPGAPGDACGGGSWWNPISWAKSLFCKLGDIVKAIADLLLGLLDGLKDLLIPDNLDFLDGLKVSMEGKFPLSVISEAVGIAQGLTDRINSGVSTAGCSTIDPDLDGALSDPNADGLDGLKFSLPTPDGSCGESAQLKKAADLAGWRSPIRALLGVAIWGAFAVRVITSFGPGRTGMEPEPEKVAQ